MAIGMSRPIRISQNLFAILHPTPSSDGGLVRSQAQSCAGVGPCSTHTLVPSKGHIEEAVGHLMSLFCCSLPSPSRRDTICNMLTNCMQELEASPWVRQASGSPYRCAEVKHHESNGAH
jgi:hypothetical protein